MFSSNNLFAINVNRATVHEKIGENGEKLFDVWVKTDMSKSGTAKYEVSESQVVTKKDRYGNLVPDYCHILLGKPNENRDLYIPVGRKNKDGEYTRFVSVKVENNEIFEMHKAEQQAYISSIRNAMKAEREGASKKLAEASISESAVEAEQEIQR